MSHLINILKGDQKIFVHLIITVRLEFEKAILFLFNYCRANQNNFFRLQRYAISRINNILQVILYHKVSVPQIF